MQLEHFTQTAFYQTVVEAVLKQYWVKQELDIPEFHDLHTLLAPYWIEMDTIGLLAWHSFNAGDDMFAEKTFGYALSQLRQLYPGRTDLETRIAQARNMGFYAATTPAIKTRIIARIIFSIKPFRNILRRITYGKACKVTTTKRLLNKLCSGSRIINTNRIVQW